MYVYNDLEMWNCQILVCQYACVPHELNMDFIRLTAMPINSYLCGNVCLQ